MRRGPSGGYDFGLKRDYRRKVWATFRDQLKREFIPIPSSHALLMPSLEGDEIETALNAGFKEQHLHIVDKEPAIVATLKRRYPRINTYGVTASRAMERLAQAGIRLRCANFDFCYQVSEPFAQELRRIAYFGHYTGHLIKPSDKLPLGAFYLADADHGVFEDVAFVAVTMLRGREPRVWTDRVKKDDVSMDALRKLSDKYMRSKTWHLEQFASIYGWDKVEQLKRKVIQEHIEPLALVRSQRDRQRLMFVSQMLVHHREVAAHGFIPDAKILRAESYLSESGQTMLWGIHRLESVGSCLRMREAANKRRIELGLTPVPFGEL